VICAAEPAMMMPMAQRTNVSFSNELGCVADAKRNKGDDGDDGDNRQELIAEGFEDAFRFGKAGAGERRAGDGGTEDESGSLVSLAAEGLSDFHL